MEDQSQTCQLRVASYNIRKSVGLDWVRNPERIVAVFAELQADVIAVQEMDRRFGARASSVPRELIEAAGFQIAGVAIRTAALGWHGNVILVRNGLVLRRAARIALPRLEPRGAVMVEVDAGPLGLRVICVHLGLVASSRRAQVGRIAGKLGRLTPMPTIILGDFNEWSHHNPNLRETAGFEVHSPGPSFHAARPSAALDLVMTKALSVTGTGVHSSPLSKRASDHLPVWADVEL